MGNIPDQWKRAFGSVDNVTSADFLKMWQMKYGQVTAPANFAIQHGAIGYPGAPGGGSATAGVAPFSGLLSGAPGASPLIIDNPQPVSFDLQAGRGNFETAAFPQVNLPAAIRPNAMQMALDDPELQANPRVQARAIRDVDELLKARAIAENQTAGAHKDAVEQKLGGYVTELFDARHQKNFDYVALAGRVNHDPILAYEPEKKEHLMDRILKASGEEQALAFGPGYMAAREGLFSAPDAPGHIADFSSLVTRDDITTAGLEDLSKRFRMAKSDVDRHAIEQQGTYLLKYANKRMSNEEDLGGGIKFPDPEGERVFNSVFAPQFVRQLSALTDEAQRTGDRAKLDKFLSRESVDAMADRIRPQSEVERQRSLTAGRLRAEKGGLPDEPPPPTPEGVNPAGWAPLMSSPPRANGMPWRKADWAAVLQDLRADPSPEAKAEFNQAFGINGYDADTVLRQLGQPQGGAEGAATATGSPAPAAKPAAGEPPKTEVDAAVQTRRDLVAERKTAWEAGIQAAAEGTAPAAKPPVPVPTWGEVWERAKAPFVAMRQASIARTERANVEAEAAPSAKAARRAEVGRGLGEEAERVRREEAQAHRESLAVLDGKLADLEGRRLAASGAARERIDRQIAYVQNEKRLLDQPPAAETPAERARRRAAEWEQGRAAAMPAGGAPPPDNGIAEAATRAEHTRRRIANRTAEWNRRRGPAASPADAEAQRISAAMNAARREPETAP